MDEESKSFLDGLLRRHVEITEALITEMRAGFAALQAEIADQREQIQANTEAVLKLIDRLPSEGQQG